MSPLLRRILLRLVLPLVAMLLLLGLLIKNPVVFLYATDYPHPHARAAQLKRHVQFLTAIPDYRWEENPAGLEAAQDYIVRELRKQGWKPEVRSYSAEGRRYSNVELLIGEEGRPRRIFGAHYDVCGQQPGADDNASGVAGLLELARLLKDRDPASLPTSIELVFYTLEEPPNFGTMKMGSYVHAKGLQMQGVSVDFMLSLEMIGYFSDKPGSQQYPFGFLRALYPGTGDFIALVSRAWPGDFSLVRRLKKVWRSESDFPLYSLNAPSLLTGIDLSDHRSYWRFGYPAAMLTDTAVFRNPNYHQRSDIPATLDYERMAKVVEGVLSLAVK